MARSEQDVFPPPRKPLEGRALCDHFIKLAELVENRGLRYAVINGIVPAELDQQPGVHGQLVAETLRYAALRVITPPAQGI